MNFCLNEHDFRTKTGKIQSNNFLIKYTFYVIKISDYPLRDSL